MSKKFVLVSQGVMTFIMAATMSGIMSRMAGLHETRSSHARFGTLAPGLAGGLTRATIVVFHFA